jgi:hypothetical protein
MSPWLSLGLCAAGVIVPLALFFVTPRRRQGRNR